MNIQIFICLCSRFINWSNCRDSCWFSGNNGIGCNWCGCFCTEEKEEKVGTHIVGSSYNYLYRHG